MANVWTRERAWEWYNAHPWLRGCNFMGSDCANRIDMWQSLHFEERLAVADEELALVAETGFNTIRIIPEYIVWRDEHDACMENFEKFLTVAAKHGISCMVVFGNDCMPPKGEGWRPLALGEQHYDWGYHGGRKNSQHGSFSTVGYHLLDEPEEAERHYEWVREIVEKYKNDERIVMWDVFNEPGNSNRASRSLPHIKKFFEIIREIDPIQPLTMGIYAFPEGEDLEHFDIERDMASYPKYGEVQQFAMENSDIVSFHCYGSLERNVMIIKQLKKLGRPIVNTEWLARCLENNVEEMFPLFFLEGIGNYCWGFVAGKYQTYEPWNSIWDRYEKDPNLKWDFTKWFHDLYRPSLRPYNPKEIEIIKRFAALADRQFEGK